MDFFLRADSDRGRSAARLFHAHGDQGTSLLPIVERHYKLC